MHYYSVIGFVPVGVVDTIRFHGRTMSIKLSPYLEMHTHIATHTHAHTHMHAHFHTHHTCTHTHTHTHV